jgi:hypothetical protein
MSDKVRKINRFTSDKARKIDLRPKQVGKIKILASGKVRKIKRQKKNWEKEQSLTPKIN